MPRTTTDLGKYVLTYLVMGAPLITLASHPAFAVALWGALICIHTGLLWIFGKGFRLEGAAVVGALSILMALFGGAYFAISTERNGTSIPRP